MDLSGPWESALVASGFDREQPAGWLLEGFLFYLPVQSMTDLLARTLTLAAPGSAIGFDVVNKLTLTHPFTRDWVQMQAASGAPWQGVLDDPEGFLAARGWQVSLTSPGAPDANYGRWPYPALSKDARHAAPVVRDRPQGVTGRSEEEETVTRYPELTPYSYAGGRDTLMDRPLLNVGWLGEGQPFPTGETTAEFQQKLLEFCRDEYAVALCRGFHTCELCDSACGRWPGVLPDLGRHGRLSAMGKFACSAAAEMRRLPFLPQQVGSHWSATEQIDVVAVNWDEAEVLYGECK